MCFKRKTVLNFFNNLSFSEGGIVKRKVNPELEGRVCERKIIIKLMNTVHYPLHKA